MQGTYSKLLVSPAITLLTTSIPGVNTLSAKLRDIVLTKIALSLQASSTSYKVESLKTTYKLLDQEITDMAQKYHWSINNGVISFPTTTGTATQQMGDQEASNDTAIDRDVVKQNKAHTQQLISDLISIAKQSEKIV